MVDATGRHEQRLLHHGRRNFWSWLRDPFVAHLGCQCRPLACVVSVGLILWCGEQNPQPRAPLEQRQRVLSRRRSIFRLSRGELELHRGGTSLPRRPKLPHHLPDFVGGTSPKPMPWWPCPDASQCGGLRLRTSDLKKKHRQAYKFLGDYHGFVPYLGLGVSRERIDLEEWDRRRVTVTFNLLEHRLGHPTKRDGRFLGVAHQPAHSSPTPTGPWGSQPHVESATHGVVIQLVDPQRREACPRTVAIPIDLASKFDLIDDHWHPRVVASLNGQDVKIAKVMPTPTKTSSSLCSRGN